MSSPYEAFVADEDDVAVLEQPLSMRTPDKTDAQAIHQLVADCSPLDLNSVYTYLLLGEHFAPTCVLAQEGDDVRGFVSAYVPPGRPKVLFVWQVAVHPEARGQGLARDMLHSVLQRPSLDAIEYIETTVGPDNRASRRMFAGLARSLHAPVRESQLFARHLFGAESHDDEPLLRIGPFGAV